MTAARRLAVVRDVPRFGIGVRVSRVMGRSGERFLSPEIQISAARAVVERAGGVIDLDVGDQGVFYDLDVSGAVAPSDRPGLGEALDLVRAGRLDGVAVYDLSRWSRETVSGLRELEEVAAAGGQVLSASETIDLETPAGIFSTTVQLAAHRMRRDEASKSWKATHQRRFDMGLPHGKVPYGYVSDSGGAAVDPILGPAITAAFADYAAGGVSQKELARRLGDLRGRPMRQGVVSQLLRNRFYVGELEFLGQTGPGRHTPLVDEVTFAAVQRRLSSERATGPHGRVPSSPVVGLLFCATCHRPLYRAGNGSRGGKPRLARLFCSGMLDRSCAGIGTPRLDELEQAVLALALQQGQDLHDQAPAAVARASRAARATAELARLRAEETSLLNDIGRLGVSHARGVMNDQAYSLAVAQLQTEHAAITGRIEQLQTAEVSAARPLAELRSAVERLALDWHDEEMTDLERRACLRLLLERVEVRRASYRGEPMGARLLPPDEGVPT